MRNLLSLCLVICSLAATSAAEPVDYVRDVLPIFQTYCISCHADGDSEGDLVMDSHAAMMKGGENGAVITAGVPSSSRLFLMAAGKLEPVMPPDGEQGPSEAELATIEAWIEQGAIGPDGDMPIKTVLRTPKIATNKNAAKPITAIAASGKSKLHALARFGSVELVDGDKVVNTIRGDFGKVNAIEFSRDGERILIASGVTGAYGDAAIYSVATGERLVEMVGHSDVLYAAVFSPDETLVATAGYDRQIVLWNAATGDPIRTFSGHNGAIFDLVFSPDGNLLVSACADETVKIWDVKTGQRFDTLSQPEGEVFTVEITADGKYVLAGSADNRLRVWRLKSVDKPRINPIVATRFVDESPLVNFALTGDGKELVVMSEAGNLKRIRTSDWTPSGVIDSVGSGASDLAIDLGGKSILVSMMNGTVERRELPAMSGKSNGKPIEGPHAVPPKYMDLGELVSVSESDAKSELKSQSGVVDVDRGARISGVISLPGQVDRFRWHARAGEVWAIDADATGKAGKIDPFIAIVDDDGQRVPRVRLQAIRDTYFTFRGKNSTQVNDFRMFNFEELNLNDFLYASGEVTRLFMRPRGPDSGFNVYPNSGNRWTFFGTTHSTHALGEPAYVVRPLAPGDQPLANGLPVFDIYYENDDDPMRMAGTGSRLLFTAPADGRYTVQVTDTRGEGGDDYGYTLAVRAAQPAFVPHVKPVTKSLRRGGGREIQINVDRTDGFDGPVKFDIQGLPEEVVSNFPVTIEKGQQSAVAMVWIPESAKGWDGEVEPTLVATAKVLGRNVERRVGSIGKLKVANRAEVISTIQPIGRTEIADSAWTLTVRRGETVPARVILDRKDGFKNEVSFGKEEAGRNSTHGVYVDNIGLNGLLVPAGMTQQDFFVTADPIAKLGKRQFFLTAGVDGGVTTHPIVVEVVE
ncbi:WD40 repeat domain-containing protein [Rubripirellula reticaptiva]|uniref:WD domain, G-beta repeat n=1 Tax=Rubripirellula reticaptiva TaxID=2528013 RepID=A0A5C6EJA3_9BACT|nr:c-type cytochrome domain-containing protein [Rubripirellula reticaptiva]TWU47741.1 WD domain, G-beta repeat [Rubripirellula reticaptiva]